MWRVSSLSSSSTTPFHIHRPHPFTKTVLIPSRQPSNYKLYRGRERRRRGGESRQGESLPFRRSRSAAANDTKNEINRAWWRETRREEGREDRS